MFEKTLRSRRDEYESEINCVLLNSEAPIVNLEILKWRGERREH